MSANTTTLVPSERITLPIPIVRLAALSLTGLWEHGRLPRVARWFDSICARPTFVPAFVEWLPAELAAEMRTNGRASWPAVAAMLGVAA